MGMNSKIPLVDIILGGDSCPPITFEAPGKPPERVQRVASSTQVSRKSHLASKRAKSHFASGALLKREARILRKVTHRT